jgi:hypothetical protein
VSRMRKQASNYMLNIVRASNMNYCKFIFVYEVFPMLARVAVLVLDLFPSYFCCFIG